MDEYKRRNSSGQRRTPAANNRSRAAARRRRRRRQRRMLIGIGLLILLILAVIIGVIISGHKKSRETAALKEEGIAYLDQGNYDAAIESFSQILEKNKGKTGKQEKTVLLYKAEAEYRKGDYQTALETIDTVIAADGEKDEYLNLKSHCQMELGDYQSALTYQPLAPVIYNRMALAAIHEERYDEALTLIEQGLAVGESKASQSLLMNQAVVYEEMGNYEKALELYESYEQTYGSSENLTNEIEFLKTR